MDATVLEITKDGVRVQLTSGMSMIVRAEHRVLKRRPGRMNTFLKSPRLRACWQ